MGTRTKKNMIPIMWRAQRTGACFRQPFLLLAQATGQSERRRGGVFSIC
jgi:hypothetical protein